MYSCGEVCLLYLWHASAEGHRMSVYNNPDIHDSKLRCLQDVKTDQGSVEERGKRNVIECLYSCL